MSHSPRGRGGKGRHGRGTRANVSAYRVGRTPALYLAPQRTTQAGPEPPAHDNRVPCAVPTSAVGSPARLRSAEPELATRVPWHDSVRQRCGDPQAMASQAPERPQDRHGPSLWVIGAPWGRLVEGMPARHVRVGGGRMLSSFGARVPLSARVDLAAGVVPRPSWAAPPSLLDRGCTMADSPRLARTPGTRTP